MSSRSRGQKIRFFIFTLVFLGASAWAQSIPNPSFETDTDYTYPGYRSTITGWTLSGGGGLNQAGQPFADNGAVPNGVRVAFLQGVAQLRTTITGLTAGKAYRVSFRANARTGHPPLGQCALNGQPAVGFTSSPSVGGSNPYYYVQQSFLATGTTAVLEISTLNTGEDTTLLVDAFVIAPVSPQLSVAGDAGVVAWGENYSGQTTVPVAAQSGVIAVAVGDDHTVALKDNGSAIAWGENSHGETTVPVAAQSGVIAIAAGASHTVALKANGSVLAWGYTGATTVPMAAQFGVIAIAAGGDHTVALKADGSVVGWGSDSYGETTVPVAAQFGVTAVAAGFYHTVALKTDGSVTAWGRNEYGETTVPVAAQSGVMAVAAGVHHTVALKANGSVIAWGSNFYGETSVPVAAQSGVIAIAAGYAHTVALKTDGSIIAWGLAASGQTTVPGAAQSGVIAVAVGTGHTVALKMISSDFGPQNVGTASAPRSYTIRNTGATPLDLTSVSITGDNATDFAVNTNGMLTSLPAGVWTTVTVAFVPVAIDFRRGTLRVLSTSQSSPTVDQGLTGTGLARRPIVSGAVLAWGDNSHGAASVPVSAQTGVVSIAAASGSSAVLKSDGSVLAWGYNSSGQTTVPVEAQSGVIAIAAVGSHMVALKADGSVVAWGYNFSGQTTVPVAAQSGVIAIAAGALHTAALKANGSVLAWGNNSYGVSTVPVTAQSGVIAVAAGGYHTVALKANGSVVAWGDNSYGQATVPVAAQSGVIAIAAGGSHTMALKANGSVVAWGLNLAGESTVPVAAQSGVIAIAAGGASSAARKTDGSVVVWGASGYGLTNVPLAARPTILAIAVSGSHVLVLKPLQAFSPQKIGTASAAKTVLIQNTENSPLNISSVSISGGNATDFTANTSGMLTTVPAGGQTTLTVTFTPSAIGSRESTLRLLSDSPTFPTYDIALTGTGMIVPGVDDFVTRPNGAAVQINVATLLANDLGSNLGITAVSATSAAGGQIEFGNGIIIYNPPASHYNIASDTFTYTVTNDSPATATATVTVTVVGNPSRSLTTSSPGVVRFNALPNTTYQLQYTGNIDAGFAWTNLLLLTTGANGSASHDDGSTDPVRFYRIVVP